MAKRKLEDILSSVANATVKMLAKKGGRGVLVKNSFLITAAHCLKINLDGRFAPLQHDILFDFVTQQGHTLSACPLVIEPCSDIAVLGPPDDQVFFQKAEDYEEFCDSMELVSLFQRRLSIFPAEQRVHVFTHNKGWITGKVTFFRDCEKFGMLSADKKIDGGTSGSPIINDAGELLGVVSVSGGPRDRVNDSGPFPFPRWALPPWIYRRMCRAGRAA